MSDFELLGIEASTPAQETEDVDRQEINTRLGEIAARLTNHLNSLVLQEVTLGDSEIDAFFNPAD